MLPARLTDTRLHRLSGTGSGSSLMTNHPAGDNLSRFLGLWKSKTGADYSR